MWRQIDDDDAEHDRISGIIQHLKKKGTSGRKPTTKTLSYYKSKNKRHISPRSLQSELHKNHADLYKIIRQSGKKGGKKGGRKTRKKWL